MPHVARADPDALEQDLQDALSQVAKRSTGNDWTDSEWTRHVAINGCGCLGADSAIDADCRLMILLEQNVDRLLEAFEESQGGGVHRLADFSAIAEDGLARPLRIRWTAP